YMIRAKSEPGFRRAVQEATTRWAGMTEPIIPVLARADTHPLWRHVLEVANVDNLVNVDLPPETAVQMAARLNLPYVELKDIDRAGGGQFNLHPSGISGGQAAVVDPNAVPGVSHVPIVWTCA